MCIFQKRKTLVVINLHKDERSTAFVAKGSILLGPLLWNQLPVQVWEADTLSAFKVRLKSSSLRKLKVINSWRPSPCSISTIPNISLVLLKVATC